MMKKLIKILGQGLLLYFGGLIEFSLLLHIAYENDAILFFATLVFFLIYCIGAILLLIKKGGKLKYIFLSISIIGFLISDACYYELYHIADKERCSDTGICSERVINKEECAKLEGTWNKIENKWFCRLKWADEKFN